MPTGDERADRTDGALSTATRPVPSTPTQFTSPERSIRRVYVKRFIIFGAGVVFGVSIFAIWYALGMPGASLFGGADDGTNGHASSYEGRSLGTSDRASDPSGTSESVKVNGRVIQTGASEGEPPASDSVRVGDRVIETRPFPDPQPEDDDRFDSSSGTHVKEVQEDRMTLMERLLRFHRGFDDTR